MVKDILDLLGRALLAFIFLFEAYDSIVYFKATKNTMTEYGLTWNQDLLIYGSIVLLLLGGLLVLVGYRASLGAICLLLYWVPITFIVYSFWNDPEEIRRVQSLGFMKNLAITGGLLMVLVNGAGKYSIKRLFATTRVSGNY